MVALLATAISAAAQGIPEDKQVALRAFIASQKMSESWPEVVRVTSLDSVNEIRRGAVDGIKDAPNLSEAQKARILAAVEQVIPSEAADIRAALLKIDAQRLMEDLAFQVYAKYFSTEELNQVATFYSSATGENFSV